MPNGYRRGGLVHRNGRTHYRRSARIARPRTVAILAFIGVGALLGGTPLIAHPYLLAGAAAVAAGIGAAWAGHRIHRARPGTVTHWAKGKVKLGVKLWLVKRNPYIAAAQTARAAAQQHQNSKPRQQSDPPTRSLTSSNRSTPGDTESDPAIGTAYSRRL